MATLARKIFASNLKRLRNLNGYSLHEVEKHTGLTYSYVSAVEQLRANISVDNIQKLADLFGVPAYMMFLPEKQEPPEPAKKPSIARKKTVRKRTPKKT